MAKQPMTGVTCEGGNYWYARVDGRREYCGEGAEGKQRAIDARSAYNLKKRDRRDMKIGLRPTTLFFTKVRDLIDWYTNLPEVQAQKSFLTRAIRMGHLKEFFGDKPITAIDADGQREYRRSRLAKKLSARTIDAELGDLRVAVNKAYSEGKLHNDLRPRKYILGHKEFPRRILLDRNLKKLCPTPMTLTSRTSLCAAGKLGCD